jgi:putative transposase
MHFETDHIYHVYNRGNQNQKIFFNDANYLFLLKKIRKEWLPFCNILCYCLMPNHFHFMIVPKVEGCNVVQSGIHHTQIFKLSFIIGKTISSYTKAINIQNCTSGSLFQKGTKAKCIDDFPELITGYNINDYLITCFNYIHQNPLKAELVKNLADWEFSSLKDYSGLRHGTLCNKEMAMEKLGIMNVNHDFPVRLNDKIVPYLF